MDPEEPPKRGRGRPRKRPADMVGVRCDVTPDELELIRKACQARGMSQAEFARAAVVAAARRAVGKKK